MRNLVQWVNGEQAVCYSNGLRVTAKRRVFGQQTLKNRQPDVPQPRGLSRPPSLERVVAQTKTPKEVPDIEVRGALQGAQGSCYGRRFEGGHVDGHVFRHE